MPSGDSAICAYECTWLLIIFKMPLFIVFILPLCMLGRVYAHCHWFGDTIFGSLIGCFCSYISIHYMHILGKHLFKLIIAISPKTIIVLSLITLILIIILRKMIINRRKKDSSFKVLKDNCNNLT